MRAFRSAYMIEVRAPLGLLARLNDAVDQPAGSAMSAEVRALDGRGKLPQHHVLVVVITAGPFARGCLEDDGLIPGVALVHEVVHAPAGLFQAKVQLPSIHVRHGEHQLLRDERVQFKVRQVWSEQ